VYPQYYLLLINGCLYKRGDQRQNWTRRYFELHYGNALKQRSQTGTAVTPVTLSYYSSPQQGLGRVRKCKGRIQLKGRSIIHSPSTSTSTSTTSISTNGSMTGSGQKKPSEHPSTADSKPHSFDLSPTFFGEFNDQNSGRNNDPGRTYRIHAASAADMAGWLTAIEKAVALANRYCYCSL
jgi:hypothetical protein